VHAQLRSVLETREAFTAEDLAARSGRQFRFSSRRVDASCRSALYDCLLRAKNRWLRRPVAIKRLRSDAANNPVFRARFRREAEAAGRLHHSAIVAIYDTGEEREATGPSIPFIVMELVEGCTLREELQEAGKLPVVRTLEVTAAVLDALACSHAAGIIHRDVKPANVMLSNTGEIKVADFGIIVASARQPRSPNRPRESDARPRRPDSGSLRRGRCQRIQRVSIQPPVAATHSSTEVPAVLGLHNDPAEPSSRQQWEIRKGQEAREV
jgi:serine/threonine protein kinase